jgi:hypothetical protein
MGLAEDLAKGSIGSNEGIIPATGGFDPTSLAVSLGLKFAGKLGLPGVSQFNDFTGGLVNKIPGVSSVSKAFGGGGENKRPGFSSFTDMGGSFKGTFLEGFQPDFLRGATGMPFNAMGPILQKRTAFAHDLINREASKLTSLGFGNLAEKLIVAQDNVFKGDAKSGQDSASRSTQVIQLALNANKSINSILSGIKNSPDTVAQFLSQSGGTSIDDIISKFKNTDEQFFNGISLKDMNLRADTRRDIFERSTSTSDIQKQFADISGFERFREIDGDPELIKYKRFLDPDDPNRNEIISGDEFERRKATFVESEINKGFNEIDRNRLGKETEAQSVVDNFNVLPDIDPNVLGSIGGLSSEGFTGNFGDGGSQPPQGDPNTDNLVQKEGIGGRLASKIPGLARQFIRPSLRRPIKPRRTSGFVGKSSSFGSRPASSFADISELRKDADVAIPSGFIRKQQSTANRADALRNIA